MSTERSPHSRMRRSPFKHRTILPRFGDAFGGLVHAYREEPNLRFHFFAAACAIAVGYAVKLEGWEIAYLSTAVVAVLFAELVNTAIERTVDLAAGEQRHPLAAVAKEVAAGAVLLSAVHAAWTALFLFALERTPAATLTAVWETITGEPWWLVLPVGVGVLGIFSDGYSKK